MTMALEIEPPTAEEYVEALLSTVEEGHGCGFDD